MVTTAATIDRRISLLQRQVHEIEQARSAATIATRTPVEMAGDLGISLDAWQARALSTEAKDIILLASRQAGKSTAAGLMALHEAVYVPGSLTLIVSPAERQSKRLLRSVRKLYARYRDLSPAISEGMLSLELRNGSEIHALPGSEDTIRGFSAVDLLILDEGARVPDELYGSVRPMLAVSNGRLVALSTPFGKRGWFWQEWTNGDGWHRELVTATEIPRISPAFLARERNRIGDWMFRQEYGCEFVEADDQFFADDLIDSMVSDDVPALFGGMAA